jgi:hypothetical protein
MLRTNCGAYGHNILWPWSLAFLVREKKKGIEKGMFFR